VAGERQFRSRMHPPLDVPRAPWRSSTDSSAMPRSRIALFNAAVLAPGSPDASPARATAHRPFARRLISGFRNPDTATPPWSQRATLAWPEFEVPAATHFEQDCRACSRNVGPSGSRKCPVDPAASPRTNRARPTVSLIYARESLGRRRMGIGPQSRIERSPKRSNAYGRRT
jgi:hypothetical protein